MNLWSPPELDTQTILSSEKSMNREKSTKDEISIFFFFFDTKSVLNFDLFSNIGHVSTCRTEHLDREASSPEK